MLLSSSSLILQVTPKLALESIMRSYNVHFMSWIELHNFFVMKRYDFYCIIYYIHSFAELQLSLSKIIVCIL